MAHPHAHRKALILPQELILFLLRWREVDCVNLPVFSGLPADVETLSVHHDPYSRAFLFQVAHPDFPEVPDGAESPVEMLEYEQVRIEGRFLNALAKHAEGHWMDEPPLAKLLRQEAVRIVKAGVKAPTESNQERTRRKLLSDLDSVQSLVLNELADLYAEDGPLCDLDLSHAYRWLASKRKWPQMERLDSWRWSFSVASEDGRGDEAAHILPEDVCKKLPGWELPGWYTTSSTSVAWEGQSDSGSAEWQRSCSAAITAAVKAVAEWLRTQ